MWVMINRYKGIVMIFLDNGVLLDKKILIGRMVFDFVGQDSDMNFYFNDSGGYGIGMVGLDDDFYKFGFFQDKFEEELVENEMC